MTEDMKGMPAWLLHKAASRRGATLLAVLVALLVLGMLFAASTSLTSARLRLSEGLGTAVQRHASGGNVKAINQQYTFTWALRDNVTRFASSASLGGWGGCDANPFIALQAFRAVNRPSNVAAGTYPFDNIRAVPTDDHGVFFTRITAVSDGIQSESQHFFNYLKTYAPSLLGDLFIVHKRPSAAVGTYDLSDNIRVEGRVVIWDAGATTENLRAQTACCANASVQRTTKNISGSALLLPQNFSAQAITTAGYGGTAHPSAVADGTLKLTDNPDFPPGSIRHIVETSGSYTQHRGPVVGTSGVSGLIGSSLNGLVNLALLLPTSSNPVIITRTTLSKISLVTLTGGNIQNILPPLSGNTSLLNVAIVLAHHPALPHLRLTGSLDVVIVLGEITTWGYSATGDLAPRIIWVDQDSKPRHVIFVGESNRPLIFVTGRGNGQETYTGFLGVAQLLTNSALRWRLHWINEFTRMTLVPPPAFAALRCTGGVRTDWSFNCSDSSNQNRLILQRDLDPRDLATLLPRDGWLEPYALTR